MCVIYQDREGKLHIENLTDTTTDYEINSFNSYSKSEITLSKPIKGVKVKHYSYSSATESTVGEYSHIPGTEGEIITVDNPLITSPNMAKSVAEWIYNYLSSRASLDSSWRADVRLDALDIVTNRNAYTSNRVLMTDVEFRYNGAFTGTGKGKVMT
jgi:hypothetical protein